MLISLYTSRAVLDALGETDFGIYNLVGGIVILFSFMNSAMSAATQRYLNYELGRGDIKQVGRVFSMSITTHICIALLVLLLGETVGLWFVMTQLNIPTDRYEAAIWVYHLPLLGCCVNILRIPYNACIIAYERMSLYAYISIVEAILRLVIVFILVFSKIDVLVFYAILMFFVIALINGVYLLYCHRHFETSHYHFFWDKPLFEQLMSFSGWSMLGSIATTGVGQGMSILLNIFYGVALNAALGISHQVHTAVASFVSSFQTAFSPQIVKTYAANQKKEFYSLTCRSSRLSYCLVFLMAPILIVGMSYFLHIWLTIVPDYTGAFAITSIVLCMIDALSGPLWMAVQATGNIRNYQLLMSVIIMSTLPIMYIMLILGISPIWVVGIRVVIHFILHLARILYLKKVLGFPSPFYMKDVMGRILFMTLLSCPLCWYASVRMTTIAELGIYSTFIFVQNSLIVAVLGFHKQERRTIILAICSRFKRDNNHE